MTQRAALAVPGDPSELASLIERFDWSRSPAGVPKSWSQSLRTALGICLKSRFPMILFWGPQLVQFYNDAYALILGERHPAALGQRARDCWPEIWDSIGPMLHGVLETGLATWSENLLLPLERNGFPEELYFTFSYSPIEDGDGIGGVFCAVTETTAFVLREREARQRAEALAELDRVKTAFFDNVSHEFRTPLTLMLGPLDDVLLAPELASEHREALEMVRRNALRLRRLVDTLLEFNRVEANRVALRRVPCDVAGLTADVASLFRSAAQRAGLALEFDIGDFERPVLLDPRLWEHVVLNLVSNAIKFTLAGSVSVRLAHDERSVLLSVEDTGAGIAPDDVPHVFERFWRGQPSHVRSVEGSGIGLALVRDIVELHGGSVSCTSRLGHGTSFAVSIPYMPADAPAQSFVREDALERLFVDEALGWTTEPAHGRTRAGGGHRPRVLCVDDNADLRGYLARILGSLYDVTCVGDGTEALRAARESRPDVMICDVMMPGMPGTELVRRIRADPALRDIPVIVLSARDADDSTSAAAIAAGADGFVAKPFSAQQLLVRVDRQLTAARVRAEEAARFRAIADHVAHIIYTHDATGAVNWANRRWYDYTGLEGAEAIEPGGWRKVLPPEDFARIMRMLARAIASGEPYEAELRMKPAGADDSALRWHALRALPMRDAGGTIAGWAGSATDVHDRRLAQDRLERELDREHRASLAFQEAALPSALPEVPGYAFAAVYEAAKGEALVGGDWYDAFRLADGRIVISVGDVMGSGLPAAVTMGAVRQAIRGAAQIHPDPASILDAVDRALRSDQPDRIVTAFVGVLDPITQMLAFASAGHPPPLLRAADGSVTELYAPDLPLGLRGENGRSRGDAGNVPLREGSLLVLYTDGLTESTRDVGAGERRLRAALDSQEVLAASDVARAIRNFVLDTPSDDVAILAVRVGQRDSRSRWTFSAADADAASAVRKAIVEALRAVGADADELGDAELVVGELIGNVVRHGRGEAEVVLDLSGGAPVVNVLDHGPGFVFHARLPRDTMSESGRGLYIVAALAHDISVVRRPEGGSHARAVLSAGRRVKP